MFVTFNIFSWSFQNKFGIISFQIDRRNDQGTMNGPQIFTKFEETNNDEII